MTVPLPDRIRENLAAVRQQITAACRRVNRDPDEVTLVAVTKYASEASVRALYDLGHRDFGESRPLQLASRAEQYPSDVRWHLIGHLQRNKAARIVTCVHRIHSVDSLRLLQRLEEVARDEARRLSVLLEVNITGEASKDGYAPSALMMEWADLAAMQHIDILGLMTMAPLTTDAECARAAFRGLRRLRNQLASQGPWPLPELSMGMSGDFEIAIEEGATCVRIGSALFAGCEPS